MNKPIARGLIKKSTLKGGIMLFNRHNFSIASLCPKAEDRYIANGIHLTKDYTEVTNGHYLIRVNVPFKGESKEKIEHYPSLEGKEIKTDFPLDQSVIVDFETAKDIEKAIPKHKTLDILNHAIISTDSNDKETEFITYDLVRQKSIKSVNSGGRYPNTEAVLKPSEESNKTLIIGVNPEYLMKLGQQFKKMGCKNMKLEFQDKDHAIRISAITDEQQDVIALLMPMKI